MNGLERLRNILVRLRGSLWLVPAAMSLVACVAAYALLQLSPRLSPPGMDQGWWLFSGDADTARNLMATLTSAMITMTSLVISITMVVLTLAANQLGPRLVTSFMGDRQIKVILGLFTGTILYLVTVLRSLTGEAVTARVPHLAVTVGTALSILCLFVLLFYIHKIARSIIADTVVDNVATALEAAIGATLGSPEDGREREAVVPRTPETAGEQRWISLGSTGYVQVIDYEHLAELLAERDSCVRVDVRAGDFVLADGEHVAVRGPVDDELADRIRDRFVVGTERSPTQDVEYAMRQLVEIALRALSPGINDPFTAIAVIHRLGAALAEAFARDMPPSAYCDALGMARVLAATPTHGTLIDSAFAQISHAGRDHPAIQLELVDMIGKLAPLARTPEQRAAMTKYVRMIERAALRSTDDPIDRAELQRRAGTVRRRLDTGVVAV